MSLPPETAELKPMGFAAAWPRFWSARPALPAVLLLLAVVFTYLPLWHAGYLWDDDVLLTSNPCIVGPLGLKEVWTTKAADICPLTITVLWSEHKLWGMVPLPYHLVNVLLHAACALLLWRVLGRLRVPGAWLGAALWALHPAQVESAAWVSETKNTLSGVFYLLAILSFLKWLASRNPDGKSNAWLYAMTLVYAACALASKSSTVVLPVILVLIVWWMEGRWNWRVVLRPWPVFFLSSLAALFSLWTQAFAVLANPGAHQTQSWAERLVTAGNAVWFYLGKIVWPQPLMIVYPVWEIDARRWVSYLPLVLVLLVLCVLWFRRNSSTRWGFFVFASFLAALLPVLDLVPMSYARYSFVADHFMYLASMGPLALAGAGIVSLADRLAPTRTWLRLVGSAVVVLSLALLSWHRSFAFVSPDALWADESAKNTRAWIAWNNLGVLLMNKGQIDQAIAQYHKALSVDPENDETYYNFGNALLRKGQFDEAAAHYQTALTINPRHSAAHINLGNLLTHEGKADEAVVQFEAALKMVPGTVEVHNNLGTARLQQGQVDAAITQYQEALAINQRNPTTHNNLGNAFLQKGRTEEALAQYRIVLQEDPNRSEIHLKLGNLMLQGGKVDDAVAEYRAALQINPNDAAAHCNLGVALAHRRQESEAIAELEEAIRLQPDYTEARNNLAKVRAFVQQMSGLR